MGTNSECPCCYFFLKYNSIWKIESDTQECPTCKHLGGVHLKAKDPKQLDRRDDDDDQDDDDRRQSGSPSGRIIRHIRPERGISSGKGQGKNRDSEKGRSKGQHRGRDYYEDRSRTPRDDHSPGVRRPPTPPRAPPAEKAHDNKDTKWQFDNSWNNESWKAGWSSSSRNSHYQGISVDDSYANSNWWSNKRWN